MRNSMKDFCEELVKKVFHPSRLMKIANRHNIDLIELLEII